MEIAALRIVEELLKAYKAMSSNTISKNNAHCNLCYHCDLAFKIIPSFENSFLFQDLQEIDKPRISDFVWHGLIKHYKNLEDLKARDYFLHFFVIFEMYRTIGQSGASTLTAIHAIKHLVDATPSTYHDTYSKFYDILNHETSIKFLVSEESFIFD